MIIDTYVQAADYLESEFCSTDGRTDNKYMITQAPWNNPSGSRFALGFNLLNYTIAFGASAPGTTYLRPQTTKDIIFHKWIYEDYFCEVPDLNLSINLSNINYITSSTNKTRLFWGYASPTYGAIKSFIQKRNGVKIVDLIPCYRKSDNVIGMYDIENNVFYTNQGTGTFIKGPDV